MKNNSLITITEFIKRAKQKGVKFGKADPYNRLRYYIKISLMPHMERKMSKEKGGKGIDALYPESALARFIKVEELKGRGFSNEEVAEMLKKEENSPKKYFEQYFNSTTVLTLVAVTILALTFLNSKGVINLSRETSAKSTADGSFILDSGVAQIKAGRRSTFVKTDKVTDLSDIHVSFKDSYVPATSFYISEKIPFEGYVLSLDTPSANTAEFLWWVLQK